MSKGRERAFQADKAPRAREQTCEVTRCSRGVGARETAAWPGPEHLVIKFVI